MDKVFLLAVVFAIFFHTIVSSSAFWRLILHSGAMGRKRVLDPQFEQNLLPGGLYVALVIWARTSVVHQYKTDKVKRRKPNGPKRLGSRLPTPQRLLKAWRIPAVQIGARRVSQRQSADHWSKRSLGRCVGCITS